MNNLYRLYDADGDLLYVGISLSAIHRLSQHMKDKPWASQIATVQIVSYPSRRAVAEAEKKAIRAEAPRHNSAHNERGQIVNNPPGREVDQRDMPDMCHDYCIRLGQDDDRIYFPYKWVDGVGHYRCRRGHMWTCGWSHRQTGHAPWEAEWSPDARPDVSERIWL